MNEALNGHSLRGSVLSKEGIAGHAIVATALMGVSFVLYAVLPQLALMVAVLTVVMVLVGRKEFRQNAQLRGSGLAAFALCGSALLLFIMMLPIIMPFTVFIF